MNKLIARIPDKQLPFVIFFCFLLARLAFILATGYNSFELMPDTIRYNEQSNAILNGNYNLTTKLFIVAPFYPYFEALVKLLFKSHWQIALQTIQIVLSSLSGVALYYLAKDLFNKNVALLAAAVYCVFPLTLWWVHTFDQDMPFQYELIFTFYFFFSALKKKNFGLFLLSAVLFSITFLTKSHILLFSPFIPLIIWFNLNESAVVRLKYIVGFVLICALSTVPYGLYNLKANGMYVLSSTGQGGHFLTGHNDDCYKWIVEPPKMNTPEYEKLAVIDSYAVFQQLQDTLKTLNQKQQQDLYLAEGIKWCKNNPGKLVKLSFYDGLYFLSPGLNFGHYPFKKWLFIFFIELPVYLFAYLGIFIALRTDFKKHFWIFGLFLTVLGFSVVFYTQNRFRVITLEPYYIIYASFGFFWFYDKYLRRKAG